MYDFFHASLLASDIGKRISVSEQRQAGQTALIETTTRLQLEKQRVSSGLMGLIEIRAAFDQMTHCCGGSFNLDL